MPASLSQPQCFNTWSWDLVAILNGATRTHSISREIWTKTCLTQHRLSVDGPELLVAKIAGMMMTMSSFRMFIIKFMITCILYLSTTNVMVKQVPFCTVLMEEPNMLLTVPRFIEMTIFPFMHTVINIQ